MEMEIVIDWKIFFYLLVLRWNNKIRNMFHISIFAVEADENKICITKFPHRYSLRSLFLHKSISNKFSLANCILLKSLLIYRSFYWRFKIWNFELTEQQKNCLWSIDGKKSCKWLNFQTHKKESFSATKMIKIILFLKTNYVDGDLQRD